MAFKKCNRGRAPSLEDTCYTFKASWLQGTSTNEAAQDTDGAERAGRHHLSQYTDLTAAWHQNSSATWKQ